MSRQTGITKLILRFNRIEVSRWALKIMPLTIGENDNTGLLFARFDDAPVIFQWD